MPRKLSFGHENLQRKFEMKNSLETKFLRIEENKRVVVTKKVVSAKKHYNQERFGKTWNANLRFDMKKKKKYLGFFREHIQSSTEIARTELRVIFKQVKPKEARTYVDPTRFSPSSPPLLAFAYLLYKHFLESDQIYIS